MVGGVLLGLGWGFTTIIPLLAIPAVLAGVAVLRARRAAEDAPRADAQNLAHT
jgi:AAHS family 4-hydroxybenzoate transporter-like MFS transporter